MDLNPSKVYQSNYNQDIYFPLKYEILNNWWDFINTLKSIFRNIYQCSMFVCLDRCDKSSGCVSFSLTNIYIHYSQSSNDCKEKYL